MKTLILLLIFPMILFTQNKKDLIIRDSIICRAIAAADTADTGKRKAGNYSDWELPPFSYTSGLGGLRAFARDTTRPWDFTEYKRTDEAGEKNIVEFHLETAGTALDTFYVEEKRITGLGTSATTSWSRVLVYQPQVSTVEDTMVTMNQWHWSSGRRYCDFTIYSPFVDIIRIRRRTPTYVCGNGVVFILVRTKRFK